MATIAEKIDSREYQKDKSARLRYQIRGYATEDDVWDLAQATAPEAFHDLVIDSIGISPEFIDTANPSSCIWNAEVDYIHPSIQPPEPMAIGDVEISYDTSGGSSHITQAIDRVASAASSGHTKSSIDEAVGLSIGVSSEGVAGVDIGVAIMDFSIRKIYATSSAPPIATIYNLTNKVNSDSFSATDTKTGRIIPTLAPGECRLTGASESRYGENAISIMYKFSAAPNQTGITIRDMSVDKKGHEYLWCMYEPFKSGNLIIQTPFYVAVNKVYQAGAFAGLLI